MSALPEPSWLTSLRAAGWTIGYGAAHRDGATVTEAGPDDPHSLLVSVDGASTLVDEEATPAEVARVVWGLRQPQEDNADAP